MSLYESHFCCASGVTFTFSKNISCPWFQLSSFPFKDFDVWNYAIYIDRNRVMTAEALGGFGDNDGAHFALLFPLSHTEAWFKFPLLTKDPRAEKLHFWDYPSLHLWSHNCEHYMTKFIPQNSTSGCAESPIFVFKQRTKCYLYVKLSWLNADTWRLCDIMERVCCMRRGNYVW